MKEIQHTKQARFYAASVLILTIAFWFWAWIGGYNIGLDLRPVMAIQAVEVIR
ncbi:MAG: hypothetical protein VB085_08680 [Peptococcaceae bacterium]|nr:hypothetical protein [Peptococcaceae bacterium]